MLEKIDKHIVIVGLGNPGKTYAMTRHNMGYMIVQAFAHIHGWTFKEDKQFIADVAKGKIGGVTIHLMLPLTYMNESGQAVRRYLDFYKLGASNIIVVNDDIDLDYGYIRVRSEGSAGGHNGLKSIQAHLGTQEYVRLRMGIGKGLQEKTLADYVLDAFSNEEKESLPSYIAEGLKILQRLINEDVAQVMNATNVRRQRTQDN